MYKAGTTNRLNIVDIIKPLITLIAIGAFILDPSPIERARGSIPKHIDIVVIKIGRSLDIPAWIIASSKVVLFSLFLFAASTIKVEFLPTKPRSKNRGNKFN